MRLETMESISRAENPSLMAMLVSEQFQRWEDFASGQNPLLRWPVHGCKASRWTGQPQTHASSWGVFQADATSCHSSALGFALTPHWVLTTVALVWTLLTSSPPTTPSPSTLQPHQPLHHLPLHTLPRLSGRLFPPVST